MEFWIPGSVPSSKNSKQAFVSKTGKQVVISSKRTLEYEKDTMWLYKSMAQHFKVALIGRDKPYKIGFKFVRGSKHKFDYINPAQTVQDLMVKYGWIEDDNADEIVPVFEEYSYDKDKPGVMISIL